MTHPANVTPMIAQYLELKRQHPDSILFYRMGDFYEMFFDDAKTAAPVLEVQLTTRDKNAEEPIAMCGVPHHSAMNYIQKLLSAGFKVALCEQLEDPATTKGLVKRGVVRVLTPALIGDPELVTEDKKLQLLVIHESGAEFGLCLLNLLDNQMRTGTAASAQIVEEVWREYSPQEILVHENICQEEWFQNLLKSSSCPRVTVRSSFFQEAPHPVEGARLALSQYLRETQCTEKLPLLNDATPLFSPTKMNLDSVTLISLEITQAASTGGKSLCETIDETVTPMGRRLLRDWLSQPSLEKEVVHSRHDAVEGFLHSPNVMESVRGLLRPMRDLERLSTKTALGLAMPRDLAAIRDVLSQLPELKHHLTQSPHKAHQALGNQLDLLEGITRELQSAIEESPPTGFRDGGIFQSHFHPQIAEYRLLSTDAKATIAGMEERERIRTGIPNLKIKFNRVFGYTIEITNSYLSKVPPDYTRKQTISTGERFITEELKNFEEKVISADHRLKALEEALFLELRGRVAAVTSVLSQNARTLAQVDVLGSFAHSARLRSYQRPIFNGDNVLSIQEGRHPVVEALLPPGAFVPNSIHLDPHHCRTMILTGPNMGGKSTIMRQIALICILAQSGSFVPASQSTLPFIDAVFTRIGSSDDLARGRSTFMVEMTEVARILKTATPQSLILIDEIGRGTSTYDGLSLAWSLLEHLHENVRAKTLFATHFHEITALETTLPGCKNANVLVEKWKEDIVFLYKLAPGICNRSYGIEVAKIAGLPSGVLHRAREIQGLLETQSQRSSKVRSGALSHHRSQLGLFDDENREEMPAS